MIDWKYYYYLIHVSFIMIYTSLCVLALYLYFFSLTDTFFKKNCGGGYYSQGWYKDVVCSVGEFSSLCFQSLLGVAYYILSNNNAI